MSHVIPPHVFQVLKSHRWNCNVLGVSQKVRAPELRASFGLRGAWIEFLCSVVGPTRSSWCPGRINPHAYLRTHAQNHGSTCANGAHTTARPHAPTKTPTFPHQQAEKSLQNQHVLSILQVGSHQLQYRFFRINNPKSRHKTNTFCPLTPLGPRVGPIGGRRTTHWASPLRTSRNAEGPTSRSTPRRIPSTQCTFAQIAPQKIHADAATMADVAFPCMPLL